MKDKSNDKNISKRRVSSLLLSLLVVGSALEVIHTSIHVHRYCPEHRTLEEPGAHHGGAADFDSTSRGEKKPAFADEKYLTEAGEDHEHRTFDNFLVRLHKDVGPAFLVGPMSLGQSIALLDVARLPHIQKAIHTHIAPKGSPPVGDFIISA